MNTIRRVIAVQKRTALLGLVSAALAIMLAFSCLPGVSVTGASTLAQSPLDTPTLEPPPAPVDTPTDTPTPTPTPTEVPTEVLAPTDTPLPTEVPADTPAPTEVPTEVPVDTPAPTEVPTDIPAPTEAPLPTDTPTEMPTEAPIPTDTPTETPIPTDTPTPTATPANEPTTSLIVRLVAGLSLAEQQQVIARNGGVESSSVPVLRMHFIDVPDSTVAEAIQRYQSDPQVSSVERDKVRQAEGTPTDPSYAEQWALPQIGWDSVFGSVTPGGSSVIAVLDTGITASHPDLSGLVLPGYSAFEGGDARSDPNGHGTRMAGIAAARTDNGTGVAGVAYAGVSLLPIQVLGPDGLGQDSDIISGIVWATDEGADVVLMAFSNPGYSPALQAAIDYAWDSGVVLVAAAGNDGSSTTTYPAGDRGVIGVSATDRDDALAGGSNYGPSVFLAAPGVDVATTDGGGGYTAVTGTSAAAAQVAGAAAFMRAVDSSLSNGVIVGRLARSADPAGTQEQTGNGRLNLARALSDTVSDPLKPAGAPPLGDGGPYVGPYVAAAQFNAVLQGQSKGSSTWIPGNLAGWQELDLIPVRVYLTGGPASNKTIVVEFDHTKTQGGTSFFGIENLTNFAPSSNVTINTGPTLSAPAGVDVWSYTFTVNLTDKQDGFVEFRARLAAGAHLFTGSSLALGGSPSLGKLQISKPAPQPGNPDLLLIKSGPTSASPGSTITYILNYQNKAGASSSATGVQLRDVIPSQVTYVPGSCTLTCSVVGNTITWDLGTLTVGTAGSKSYQVTVNSGLPHGSTFANAATIRSAENDANPADNDSKVTTTVSFNRAPVANNDSYNVNEDTTLTVAAPGVLSNDTDADGDPLTAVLVSGPAHGTLTLNANGSFSYTPDANYNGPDSFTYKANDGTADSNVATVSITVNPVNDKPTAAAVTTSTAEDVAKVIGLSSSDVETCDLTFSVVTPPSHGTLSVISDNACVAGSPNSDSASVTYTPDANYNGPDSFTYKTNDGALDSNVATVTITVNAVNDAPILGAIGNKTINEEVELSFTVTASDVESPPEILTFSLVGAPAGAGIDGSTGAFTWTPTEAQGPADYTFTVKVCDDGSPVLCDEEAITVHVNEVNVAPVLGAIGDKSVDEETELTFTATASDHDIPVQTLAFSLVDAPAGASITAGGDFTWTPTEAQGPATYTFDVCVSDGVADPVCETIKVTVNEVNVAPLLAAIGNKTVDEETLLSFTATASDHDIPVQTLAFSLVDAPAGASITAGGDFTWTPTEAQGPATYTFDVCVSDGVADPVCETIKVTVNEVNVAPLLAAIGNKTVLWGNPLTFTATASDHDIPANTLTFGLISAPTGASINSSTGAFTWTPTSAQVGSHTFKVRVTDNGSPNLYDEEEITVTVGERPTQIVYSGDSSGQYSDPVTVKATLTDNGGGSLQGTPLPGKTVGFKIGSQSASAATGSTGLAQTTITLSQMAGAPGVTSTFSGDALYLSSDDSDLFTINKENATIEYTGDTLKTTSSTSTSSTASVNLAAVIKEEADGSIGSNLNITQIKFTVFKFTDTAMTSPVASCTAPVAAAGTGIGTATCPVTLTADNYTVKIELLPNSYYIAPVETVAVTVVLPGTGFTTGGGWIMEPKLGTRSNFGFTVKYLKNGKIQGNSLYIYRVRTNIGYGLRDYNWIIKSNAMGALTQACTTTLPRICKATFTGKSTITAVDRVTGIAYGLGGNYQFQVDVTDNGEPGSSPGVGPDTYAIRVWNSTGTCYQLGTPAAQVKINGGNIQVRP